MSPVKPSSIAMILSAGAAQSSSQYNHRSSKKDLIKNMTLPTVQFKSQCGYSGFPTSHVQFLRCKSDKGELQIAAVSSELPGFIRDGLLRCCSCGREYPIIDGIVHMLENQELDAEGAHELRLRDKTIEKRPDAYEYLLGELRNNLEMKATLAALNLYGGCALLELACGPGRYTTTFVGKCKALVAVDFSLESLFALARKIHPGSQVGLVLADITRLTVAPRSFDRVLSTTSLDSREQRMVMNRLVADALTDKGRFVFSTEFYDLRSRLLGLPRARRYTPGGIYYCHLEKDEIIQETAPFFRRVRVRPINVVVPFSSRLGYMAQLVISQVAEQIPLLRNFGELLLVSAINAIRPPEEGKYLAGNKLFKTIYHWYWDRRKPEIEGDKN